MALLAIFQFWCHRNEQFLAKFDCCQHSSLSNGERYWYVHNQFNFIRSRVIDGEYPQCDTSRGSCDWSSLFSNLPSRSVDNDRFHNWYYQYNMLSQTYAQIARVHWTLRYLWYPQFARYSWPSGRILECYYCGFL